MAYVTYTAKREIEPTGFSKTGTDLSSIGSDDSFDAATTDLSGLLIDQWLQAAGFVQNSGWFQVKSNSTSAKILTNTPPVTHLRLPGVAGNYASTPDSAATSVTGSIDLRCQCTANDWSPATQILVAKDDLATNRDYGLYIGSGDVLNFFYTSDGSTATGRVANSTVPTGFVDGSRHWVRATYNSATGDVKFYTSGDGIVWTQLGATVTITSGSIHNGTTALQVGTQAGGTGNFSGRIYYAEVRNGIDGTVVAAFDPTRGTRGAGSLVALTGETWTINTSGTPPALLQGPLLTYEGAEFLTFASGSGPSATTPDSAATSVTGSIELMAKAMLNDWSPAANMEFIAKDDVATNRDYELSTDSGSSGKLHFVYTTDGSTTAGRVAISTVAVPFADGSIGWVKVTYNSGTGDVKFYTSADGVTFTQLGTTVTLTSGAIHNGTSVLAVGTNAAGSNQLVGRIYYAEVRNGIGGPVVAAFDPARAAAGASTLVAYTGETWTLAANSLLARVTPVTITGYKRGFGQSYNIEFKAEQVDRKVKVKRSSQQPIGGGAPEVLLYRQEATVDVLTEILSEASQVPQFREFLASVSAGEVFTFDRYGTVASPVDPRQAILESADYEEQRVMATLQQRIPFTVRLLT